MRDPARDEGRLQDIIIAAEYIIRFTEGIDFKAFVLDKLRCVTLSEGRLEVVDAEVVAEGVVTGSGSESGACQTASQKELSVRRLQKWL